MPTIIQTPELPEEESKNNLDELINSFREEINNLEYLIDLETKLKKHIHNLIISASKKDPEYNLDELILKSISTILKKYSEENNEINNLIETVYNNTYSGSDDINKILKEYLNKINFYSISRSKNIHSLKEIINLHNDHLDEEFELINTMQDELRKLPVYDSLFRNKADFIINLKTRKINYTNAVNVLISIYRWAQLQFILTSEQNSFDETSKILYYEFAVSLCNICETNLNKIYVEKSFSRCIKNGLNNISTIVKKSYLEFPCKNTVEFNENFNKILNRIIASYITKKNDEECIAYLLYCSCMIRNLSMHGIDRNLIFYDNKEMLLNVIGVLFSTNMSILHLIEKNDTV